MVFGLAPLHAASLIFVNSMFAKFYMTTWRTANPDGKPGNPKYENVHKAQLNEAEWSRECCGSNPRRCPYLSARLHAPGRPERL